MTALIGLNNTSGFSWYSENNLCVSVEMEVALVIKKEKNNNETPQTLTICVVYVAKRHRRKKYCSTVIVWSKGYYFIFLKESSIFKMQSVLFEEKTV